MPEAPELVPERSRAPVIRAAAVLATVGLGAAVVAFLDPRHPAGLWLGVPLTLAGVALDPGPAERRRPALRFAALLAAALALASATGTEFRADSARYYAYLRSTAFDHDLDFANEYAALGLPEAPLTPTGLRRNVHPVGPAVLWSPFFLVGHLYARSFGGEHFAADGFSLPYLRAAALGTLVVGLLGAWLLAQALAARGGEGRAAFVVAAAVAGSPVVYYLLVVPTMAHGLTFGLAAALLWALDRARRSPTAGGWLLTGALLGLLTLCRWQAAILSLAVVAVGLEGLVRRRVRGLWLAGGAAAAIFAFAPQMVAWKILYGRFLTVPQGAGFLDASAPHLREVLLSADHGFFHGSPVMALGVAGLLLGLRTFPGPSAAGLLTLGAVAWVNGGVVDWAGGDAFGARRFDLVVPWMALGLSLLWQEAATLHRAAGILLAAAMVAGMLWNAAFIAAFREGRFPDAAPYAELAGEPLRQARRAALGVTHWMGSAAGGGGDSLTTSGEGVIDISRLQEGALSGWSSPRRAESPPFRWALRPRSCVRLPATPARRAVLGVRAPRQGGAASVSLTVDGAPAGTAPLGPGWSEVEVALPAGAAERAPLLCLDFPRDPAADDAGLVAAAVSTIRLR